jgi:DnaJ-class molecular chaperone
MSETFYTALGVEADADREMIQRAYRDHVNETHPDVSDSSWAPEADTSGETETRVPG